MKVLYAKAVILLCMFFVFFSKHASTQNFHLVKDINTTTSSNPRNSGTYFRDTFAVLKGVSYFNADDGEHGRGLWRSDGTAAGTYQVKESIDPIDIIVANDKLFFSANSVANLWVSDGTNAGTRPVLDTVPAGVSSFVPKNITNVNGTVYFSITGLNPDDQLWKTDGTAAGTVLVKDFYNPSDNIPLLMLNNFKAVFNKLFFTISAITSGVEGGSRLWTTDGTTAGTYKITDEAVGPSDIIAPFSTAPDSALIYFTSPSPRSPMWLWVTNGQPGNAQLINTTIAFNSTKPSNLFAISGVLYFVGEDFSGNSGAFNLYRYDKNSGQGIQRITFFDAPTYANPAGVVEYDLAGERVFFTVFDVRVNEYQLWATNPVRTSAQMIKGNLQATAFTDVNGVAYFTNIDSANGNELWRSDGTAQGTVLVKDIFPGKASSDPLALTSFGNVLLFSALNNRYGRELWSSDGSIAGTKQVKDINTKATNSAYISYVTPLKTKVVFTANSGFGQTNSDLWSSDGTNAGTTIIKDTIVPNHYSHPPHMTATAKNAYFFYNINNTDILFKTDGTSAGTIAIDTFGVATDFAATDSLFYFISNETVNGQQVTQIWRTDGTKANTFTIGENAALTFPFNAVKSGNKLYFISNFDTQLWVTDGTEKGTILVKIFTRVRSGLAFNGKLFFEANDGINAGLFSSNGTAAGTKFLSDLSGVTGYTISNGMLFFAATRNAGVSGNSGTELFKTDGSSAGTQLVKDIYEGAESSSPSYLTDVNGVLYFFAQDKAHGFETSVLWRSDGTTGGTKPVKALASGVMPSTMVNANGRAYFLVPDLYSYYNFNLWQSDGTDEGTHAVNDTALAGLNIDDFTLTPVSDRLFFSGTNYAYGSELWVGDVGSTLPITLINFAGTLVANDGILQWTAINNSTMEMFELERSIDGIHFFTITLMPALRNGAENKYSYTDKNLDAFHVPKVFYRLKQVDNNGHIEYSKIVALNLGKNNAQITYAPNPVRRELQIYSSVAIDRATIKITDLSGKLVMTRHENIVANTAVSINVMSLSKGVYIVSITNADMHQNLMVIKE